MSGRDTTPPPPDEALRRSEERHRAVLEALPDLMFVLDEDERYTDFYAGPNARLYAPPGEFLGRTMREVLPPEAYAAIAPVFGDVRRTRAVGVVEFMLPLADGDGCFEARMAPCGARHIVAMVRDVTEQRRAERALQASEQRLRAVLNALPDLMFIFDARGTYLDYYAGTSGLLYVPPEAFLGRRAREVLPAEVAATIETAIAAARREGATQAVEYALAIGGRTTYFEGRVGPHGDEQFVMLVRDVTERKALEAELLQSQKMESIGRLAGGVAHDFNNLLTVVMGSVFLVEQCLDAGEDPRAHLGNIRIAAGRAGQLTAQLLAFARRQVLQLRVLDVNALVAEVDRLLRHLLREDIELQTITAPELWAVRADAHQFERVLVNLAVNARDAMPAGGRLTVETANVALDTAQTRAHAGMLPGDYVLVAVSDTGVGMDGTTLQHVFEPFFTTKRDGTGLGLATCYGIVKQLGGHIAVSTESGRGTTFRVYLPRAVEAPEVNAAPSDPAPSGVETVLVVEDDALVRDVAIQGLRAQGYTVVAASHGAQALEIAASHKGPIHALVTDVVMPGMSGGELAARFRALRPEARVLFVSGYNDDEVVRHGVSDTGAAFLQKPFTPDALGRRLREVLGD